MIQNEDNEKIEQLRDKLGVKTKIEVLRTALILLEEKIIKEARIKRWQKAAKLVGGTGLEVMKEFQTKKRFEKLP